MRFLDSEYNDVHGNIYSFIEEKDFNSLLPKSLNKLKILIKDIVTIVYGKDFIIEERIDKEKFYYSIVVEYELEKPFVGFNQNRSDEPRILTYHSEWFIRYWAEEKGYTYGENRDVTDKFKPYDIGKVIA